MGLFPLAAAVVEHFDSALTGSPHQLPVFEIVGRQFASGKIITGVVRQHFVAKIEAEHAQGATARVDNRENLAILAENLQQFLEIAFGHGRRAVAMYVIGVEGEKPVNQSVSISLRSPRA